MSRVLTHDQSHALTSVIEWYTKDRASMQHVAIGGYAGTGKTMLIACIREELAKLYPHLRVSFVSFTGKATRVLLSALKCEECIHPQDTVSTIHSLIYSPIVNEKEEIVGWKQKDALDCDLIIVDEASMVDEFIWNHLCSYRIPLVVMGDHGQLPPIQGSFSLMKKPDIYLTHIHRQKEDSPIIQVSKMARESGIIPPGIYGKNVIKYNRSDPLSQETLEELLSSYTKDTLLLCGLNATRKRLNTYIRGLLGFESMEPSCGDRVICLRNNHKKKIYNGELGTLERIHDFDENWFDVDIRMDEDEDVYSGLIYKEQFVSKESLNFTSRRGASARGDLFDFGYAVTVHKAQGSQAKRVVLLEERFGRMTDIDWKRWLYTAVTRAEEELFIFGS